MKTWQALACACVLLGIVGCKGGGGGKKAQQQAPAAASVSVSISTPEIVGESIVGDSGYRAALNGSWSGSNLGSGQVWLEVSDSAGSFVMPARQQASGSAFGYTLVQASGLAEGARSGNLTVRACKDAQCTQPYPNASASVGYRLQVREPVVRVAIATPPLAETVDPDDAFTTAVGGTWTATYLGSNPVYLQISDNAGTFVSPAPATASGDGRFQYTLPLVGGLPTGPRGGLITVRACRDALCTQPYRDATMSIAYQLQIARIAEWETHQRNAAHDGYVPITLDYRRFAKVWEWQRPPGVEPIGGINAVATSNGTVYTSTDVYFGEATLHALDETTGQPRWSQAIGYAPAMNPPAYHDGRVYVSTTGHADTFLWSFDAADGTLRFKSPFSTQWSNVLAPTVDGDQVFTDGGYQGGVVYAYDRLSGASQWEHTGGFLYMNTPAVDADHIYHHTGYALRIVDRRSGVLLAEIADPSSGINYSNYHGAPVLGRRDNVIAYSGTGFSGRLAASSEHTQQRALTSFNIGARTREWSTQQAYLTQPALANGVLYAGRNYPMSLDAIDETTGQVLWSWTPPAIYGDSSFQRNVVVTRNLLFVSTDRSVYAIDLATRQAVWRYDEPGMLAISANRTLYITTGAFLSDGKLVAIRLK
ncbi:PQQ-binding-like beta-propeller repeat protein [Lysobacter panacisoli]|uniref:Pyrrolo-quinoline quinone repeat domain-containing protein n=1 Tax=Lysobacter panacisoli TaxID=1255263 RepID=A0ABP9L6J0_9GAMM|nr:PQQ-binding-like beta-propeller repeat protein [Lysobacter panacisoli]